MARTVEGLGKFEFINIEMYWSELLKMCFRGR